MHFFVEVVLYKNPSTVIELEKGVCCQYGLLDVYDHPKMAAAVEVLLHWIEITIHQVPLGMNVGYWAITEEYMSSKVLGGGSHPFSYLGVQKVAAHIWQTNY